MTKRVLALVVLPLAVGVTAYLAWRQADVRIVTWFPHVISAALRATLGRVPMPSVVVGSLPDAAWAWAFGASMALMWRTATWREAAPWLAAGAVLAVGVELGQAVRVIPGTFDMIDLLAIAVGYAAGAFCAIRWRDGVGQDQVVLARRRATAARRV